MYAAIQYGTKWDTKKKWNLLISITSLLPFPDPSFQVVVFDLSRRLVTWIKQLINLCWVPPFPPQVLPYPLLCWMQGWTLLAHGRPGVQLRPKGGARSFLTRIIEAVAIWMYHGAWYFCGNYLVKAPGPNLTEPEAKLGKHNINTWPDPNSVEC